MFYTKMSSLRLYRTDDKERLLETADNRLSSGMNRKLRLSNLLPIRFRYTPLNAVLGVVLIFLLVEAFYSYRKPKSLPTEILRLQGLLQKNRSTSGKCEVPDLDPWHESILKYYHKVSPLPCSSLQDNITVLKDGILTILDEHKNKVTCSCRTFEFNTGVSDFKVKYNDWVDVGPEDGTKIDGEFVEVSCYSKGILKTNVYNYHWNQIIKRNISAVSGRPFEKSSEDRPSVVVFGIDSMSRSNFVRTLPKTYEVMKSMGFIDMHGHVKVGDNTFPNWMAMITGRRSPATREFESELPEDTTAYFDDWPLIWKNYSQEGYATFFAEDRPQIATFALLKRNGFNSTPVDHYMRPYWLEAYWSMLARRSDPYCYDRIPFHVLQLNYLSQFVQKYDGTRSFAWYWMQDLCHNWLNQIGVADADFANFLTQNQKHFENTIILMLSDHGNRYDTIVESVIGRLESRLPYLSFHLPKKLQDKYPHVMKYLGENSQKMTTQFDLYPTFKDILQGSFKERKEEPMPHQRAYSLFQKTPDARTCYESNVPEDYCPCFDEAVIPESESKEPANQLIGFINGLFEDLGDGGKESKKITPGYKCLELQIESIEYASVRLPPSGFIEDLQDARADTSSGLELRYHIIVKAKQPSGALLEGVVIKDLTDGLWSSTGEFERNNKYGNTSHCVSDADLKKTCYCVEVN